MNEYETRRFFDLKPPIKINDKIEKYQKEMDELHQKYTHDIDFYKGLPLVQLQLSAYRIEDEMIVFNKYFNK